MTSSLAAAAAARGRRQRGMSLVELMVGLVIGMLVTTALLRLFASVSGNAQELGRSTEQMENGRYAAELLRDEVQMAGFWGELATQGAAWTTPDPCLTAPAGFAADPLALPTAVRGYTTTEALGCLSQRQPGTDAIVIRRVASATTPVAAIAANGAQHFLQTSFCRDDPANLPIVMDRRSAEFVLRNRACTAANPARAVISRIYFVARCNRCGDGGDTVPTLKRVELEGDRLVETALVDGIETMRLEYGFDTDGDGSPDAWLAAPGAGAAGLWQNVVAVRVHLVVRSVLPTINEGLVRTQRFTLGALGEIETPADRFQRRAVSQTIRLVNPAGAREVQ